MSDPTLAYWPADTDGPELWDITLGDLLDRQAQALPHRLAVVVDEQGGAVSTRWTYAELKSDADALARGLIDWGIGAGDRVAVMAQNCPAWVLLEYALAKVGAVLVTVNPALKPAELAYLLDQGQVAALVFAPGFRGSDIAGDLRALLPDLASVSEGMRPSGGPFPALRRLAVIGAGAPFARRFDDILATGRGLDDSARAARQAAVRALDVAQIQYTSGTTGKPKGAMLTHHSTVNNARLMADRGGYLPQDILLSAMPLFHTAGCVCNVMAMAACGGTLVTMDSFDPARMLALWAEFAPSLINAVPTMMVRMLEHPDYGPQASRRLRRIITGGTSIPPSLMLKLREATGGEPLIIMGMTECSPIITQTRDSDPLETRVSTAGVPLPHTEIRIADVESGQTLAFGASGELCIRGYLVMKGYFDMPEKTAETIDAEGWLHSGDLAVLDATGHLRIVGRLKDMIIRGGENVYPVEIEDCLLSHPNVSQAQVVGVPDPDLGEESYAVVVLIEGAQATPAALQAHCRSRMARHKMPKYVEIVKELPMTANGKVQKFALREAAVAALRDGRVKAVRA
ncbi:MAG: AMP-binding protein [Rhodobacter sp.]|uniref:AMP-binding protein n=1 Tax=Pararhodobacter sp. TaxID=2127056 RepID=UPI001E05EE56|nr:AMP-binding protein [Pararhodobacter sp.]MCB1344862.1 AMP-binding protein [Paracoccaceae bacterium]MCC0072677.1 AMP-binding protein [Rhodobacter sp.]HPD92449.1 AMP-binding protein [Pararhodobacter sp.]